MYPDPKRIRTNKLTLRLDDYEHQLVLALALANDQGEQPIALRLTDNERERTFKFAQADGRSASNFARLMYLRGLADFEREQADSTSPA